MPSIEDMTGNFDLEVEMVPLEQIELDPENPNELSDEFYEALVANIRDDGFSQPVAIWRRDENSYRMIDGEHRFRAVRDLGGTAIPAVVVDARDEDDARLRLLAMNRLRGTFVPIKLAYLLKDLATRIPEKEMRKRLGMEASEMKDVLRLATFTDPLADRMKEAVEREQKEAPVVLKFVCSQRDAAVIERAVDALVEDKTDRGKALASVCRAWEKSRKS